ncbi:hypothetical protein [Streptomyces sp. NPDC059278]|uniref:hypothetical protein n=1 Tax=Streptomyces sp. NPDC059278 TaxID=3346801 RepID=UPI00368EFD1E
MRIVYDFEFIEDGKTISPVSLGAAADDGRELYAVFAELDETAMVMDPWLSKHVWPKLPLTACPTGHRCLTRGRGHLDRDDPDVRSTAQIARMWSQFIADTPAPTLWADHAAYDHVTQAQLFGRMVDRPPHIPMYTNEIQQEADRHPRLVLPEMARGTAHHALNDARHGLEILRRIDAL